MNKNLLIILCGFFCFQASFSKTKVNTKCVAHRGNNKYFLENSIQAVKSASSIGADAIEIDIRHTKDGHAILMHDSTLKRVAKNKLNKVCPLNRKIKKLNIIDIRSNCILKNNEEIPLLIEALESINLSKTAWFIELKDVPNRNTYNIIKSYIPSYQDKKIISFKSKALNKIKRFTQGQDNHIDIEMFKLYYVYLFHKSGFHADVKFTPFNFRRLNRKPKRIKKAIWTIDSSKKIEKALKAKIEYITTNDPELCLFLKNRMSKILRSNNRLSTFKNLKL